jgi:hypothetical protein
MISVCACSLNNPIWKAHAPCHSVICGLTDSIIFFLHNHISDTIIIYIILFFFFNRHYNPSWVSACSTIVELSQQEGFTECRCQRHVKPPTWRRTSDLEHSNFRHERPPASEATLANPAAEGGTMREKWPRNFGESGDFHVTFGFFYMP